MLSMQECAAIESNLFPSARWLVHGRPDFPWHRDREGTITACDPRSSQALALDFFGTIDRLQSRDAVMGRIAEELNLSPLGPWSITPEALVPPDLLGEPRQTQVDALGQGYEALILFECKFTETDGGSCSQPIPIRRGTHKGLRQCTGNYQHQLNPVSRTWSRCALTTKGVKYWQLMPHALRVDPNVDHIPCPFAGGWYQWMRNLIAAAAMSGAAGAPAAFAVVFADGPFPMAQKVLSDDWRQLKALVSGTVPLQAVSYQTLVAWARGAACAADQSVLFDCGEWIEGKIISAAT